MIINPGRGVVVNLPGISGSPLVAFSAADLGYPRATRTYKALEFKVDRPYDGVWSLGGSYTLSWSKGNSEGFVQSDFGQADAGQTVDFDQPGFLPGAYGYLPNDRRHRIKLYGSYTFWGHFTVGSNISVESPRHLSCFGFNPTDEFANAYGAASHYCGGVLSPRGTAQKSDWIKQVDLKLAERIPTVVGQLVLRADVFNLFNSQSVEKRYEFGDRDVNYGPNGLPVEYFADPQYGVPTVYQPPRFIRLGLDIVFGRSAAQARPASPLVPQPVP